ncbi:MAG: DUF3467 domain-containing protein [Elusimicrobia bacterium]|nr:DUF3467 domain-containing protein [Elusimicrobiota bacterium]
MAEPEKNRLQIEIDETTAQGIYSNLAFIAHSEQEFVLDFMFLSPQQPRAKVRARIITSPKHAKRFLNALAENIQRHEQRFGEIAVGEPPSADTFN